MRSPSPSATHASRSAGRDGHGYPRQLLGPQIPLAARILAVVDSFDAMIHDRPYRDALPVDWALADLRRAAGSQFDPAVVDAFLELQGAQSAPSAGWNSPSPTIE